MGLDDIEDYGRLTKAIKNVFIEVFPEWEELPTGHRLNVLWSKVKEVIYDS